MPADPQIVEASGRISQILFVTFLKVIVPTAAVVALVGYARAALRHRRRYPKPTGIRRPTNRR